MKQLTSLFKKPDQIKEDVFDTKVSLEDTLGEYIGKHIGYSFWNLEIENIKNGTCYIYSGIHHPQLSVKSDKIQKEELRILQELIDLGIKKFEFVSTEIMYLYVECPKWSPDIEIICKTGITVSLYTPNVEFANISFDTGKKDIEFLSDHASKNTNLNFNRCYFDCNSITTVNDAINLNFNNCSLKNVKEINTILNMPWSDMSGSELKHWDAARDTVERCLDHKKIKEDIGTLLKMGDLKNFKGLIKIWNKALKKEYVFKHKSNKYRGSKYENILDNDWIIYTHYNYNKKPKRPYIVLK